LVLINLTVSGSGGGELNGPNLVLSIVNTEPPVFSTILNYHTNSEPLLTDGHKHNHGNKFLFRKERIYQSIYRNVIGKVHTQECLFLRVTFSTLLVEFPVAKSELSSFSLTNGDSGH
jgi:hypothetical protein